MAGEVAPVGEMRNANRILARSPEGKEYCAIDS
jgi:hypothetical protein